MPAICSGGGGGNTCSMTCTGGKLPEWGAECTQDGDQLQCTCTSGANAGKTFTITAEVLRARVVLSMIL